MNEQRSLFYHLAEAYERYRAERRSTRETQAPPTQPRWWRRLARPLMPNIGTILIVAALLWAQSAGALPVGRVGNSLLQSSTTTIAYQGRLADSAGNPITDTVNMIFRLYDVPSGGVPLWEEQWTGSNGVKVSDGLFNVMLGSLNPIGADVIAGHDQLWLGITVGTDDEMQPRVQLGSVPYAVQALTVPDGSITTAKIADGAVTQAKLGADVSLEPPDGSITTAKLADGAVTSAKLNVDNGLPVSGDLTVINGKVGIGTTSPNVPLTIFRPSGGDELTLASDGGASVGVAFATSYPGNLSARIRTADDANWGTSLLFETRTGGPATNTTRRMIITSRGNVGIGPEGFNPSERLHVDGNILATGSKSALVNTAHHGQRKLYAAESPEVRFFDEGLARLQDGIARLELDPIFLETIEGDYLVHVTPYGDAGLYVAEVGKDYFVVKAREGDPNVTFAWRLSAHRKGYAGVRLEEVRTADRQENADYGPGIRGFLPVRGSEIEHPSGDTLMHD